MYFENRRWSVISRRATDEYRGCVGSNGDVFDEVVGMSWRSHGDGIVPREELMWGGYILGKTAHIAAAEWDHGRRLEITFVLLAYYWVKRKMRKRSAKHRHSIEVIRRAVREDWWASAIDHPNIADVSPICLGHFKLLCTSPKVRRLLCAVQRCSATKKFQCMHTIVSWCPDSLVKHGDYSRTSLIILYICRTTRVSWRCTNVCIAKALGGSNINESKVCICVLLNGNVDVFTCRSWLWNSLRNETTNHSQYLVFIQPQGHVYVHNCH